jgi:hypothetical protein
MFKQGEKYMQNLENKIKNIFKSKVTEGFSGILGSNVDMETTFATDNASTASNVNRLNNNIAQYGRDYTSLQARRDLYLNDSSNNFTMEKNYNIYVNKTQTQSQISESNQLGCVRPESISNLSLAAGFNDAYPANFTSYADANAACKLWAADSNASVYALKQDQATGGFICSTGSALASELKRQIKPKNVYTVKAGTAGEAEGGLFGSGQVGIWNGQNNIQWNINNMDSITYIKKYNSTNYTGGPAPMQTAVNGGWWGTSRPGNKNNWGVNVWSSDTKCWWIGNGGDKPASYFYYIYDSPVAKPAFGYMIFPTTQRIKLNGNSIYMFNGILGPNGGSFSHVNLIKGKNVFEVYSPSGFPTSGFIMYWTDFPTFKNILFRSGDDGWGVSSNPVPDWRLITKAPSDKANPYGIKTVNSVPTKYESCDPINGGMINPKSIVATFGRNCSNITAPTSPKLIGGYEYTKAEAAQQCENIGQRLCYKRELMQSDICSCGWTQDNIDPGYPMANGDKTGKGWCGGYNNGQTWRTCGPKDWLSSDGTILHSGGKYPDGQRHASAHCCKKN